MDKILELLKIDVLNEDQQKEIAQKLNDIVDVRVTERVNEALEVEKESLLESLEEKFEEYKVDITTKFSNFIDDILEAELIIPENILEYARKGELYSDLIDQFKVKIGIDEGILDEEARGLLGEAKDEILKLQDEVNDLTEEKLVLEADAQEFAAELYKMNKCEGLPTGQRTKILGLLEGVTSAENIDRKFRLILESNLHTTEDNPVTDAPEGDGKVTIINEDKQEVDDKNPFELHKARWIKILKEGTV